MEAFNAVSSIATVGELVAAIWQLRMGISDGRARDDERRVERALTLYEAVVAEGSTQEAFHRLSVLLRRIGSAESSRTTWHVISDRDIESGGCLDPANTRREQAFADMYSVLWFFERSKLSLDRQLVSEDVLMETLGYHFWWWGQVLRELHGPKASHALHQLALRAELWATSMHRIDDWRIRSAGDFGGGNSVQREELGSDSNP